MSHSFPLVYLLLDKIKTVPKHVDTLTSLLQRPNFLEQLKDLCIVIVRLVFQPLLTKTELSNLGSQFSSPC